MAIYSLANEAEFLSYFISLSFIFSSGFTDLVSNCKQSEQSTYFNIFDGGHTNLLVHESAAFLSFFCLVFPAVPSTQRSPPPQAWPAPEAVACRGKWSEGNTSPSIS